ncbi:Cys/Met metabolism PLP-dependent enzyme [Colletotrichum orchidophilum]|uniref:Cys/Met metabolism PLP-dependent enzyme n=1 Tax=Colletotrichum orchidophilum TaxID=1209926 RepID=A0A1G4AMD6_9PEZI|nr:Cys/Met metabolism PLP-dependent enzyme [Colletotrichum orchidophilum]OHE90339.1 Cys/Met metabolism PLP-dependent enzyme [Colletotrichum orchidophilum]
MAGDIPTNGDTETRAASGSGSEVPTTDDGVSKLSLATLTVHADDGISSHRAIAPAMHVSTTFKYNRNPDELRYGENVDPSAPGDSHVYSRYSGPNTTRLEAILSTVLGGPSLTYSSGLSAFHAMLVFLNPKRVAIGGGYHGCHGVIKILTKLNGLKQVELDEASLEQLEAGDVLHVETPLNPTGEARNLAYFREVATRKGAYLTVDATFAPPPLQDPFALGADVVMHSGTKYFGGHSDMLCGTLSLNPRHADKWMPELLMERCFIGSVMGSMEGWLGVRSMRTLELRVKRQSESATKLVAWLDGEVRGNPGGLVGSVVDKVQHASLQKADLEGGDQWLRKQMPGGFGPVFALLLKDEGDAKRLPSKMALFHHATSLGGVESLIEWRAMSDSGCSKRLLRVSVGVEGWEDLRDDLVQAFKELAEEKKKRV